MGYLVLNDYLKTIQEANLAQIITSNQEVRKAAESIAQTEIIGYLTQKYDMAAEFSDTTVFDMTTVYKGGNLVELNFSDYSNAATYALKDLCTQSGKCYVCSIAIGTPKDFDVADWTLIGNKFDLFYIKLPNPEFDIDATYKVSDVVFWKDKTYTCKIASGTAYPSIQYLTKDNIPNKNILPDDSINGVTYWGVGVPYSVVAETLPTDTSKWVKGDNRSSKMIQVYIDIALYHLHSRVSPQNVPVLRVERYMGKTEDKLSKNGRLMFPEYCALGWLQSMAMGELTADFPLLQPKQGNRIRFGGNIPMQTDY